MVEQRSCREIQKQELLNQLGFIQVAHLIDWLSRHGSSLKDVEPAFLMGVIAGVQLQEAVRSQEYEPDVIDLKKTWS